MSHRYGRVVLSAWVDPLIRDRARAAAIEENVPFSRWVERAVRRAIAEDSMSCALLAAAVADKGDNA